MNWTQVDIYTATPAIDLLSVRVFAGSGDPRVCMVQDTFRIFGSFWNRERRQVGLSGGRAHGNSKAVKPASGLPAGRCTGARMLAALRTMLAQMKAEDTEHQYRQTGSCLLRHSGGGLGRQLETVFQSRFRWETSCTSSPAGKNPPQKPPAEPFWRSIRQRLRHRTAPHHTRLCLELMENEITPATRLLDLGAADGILFIGMLLGAKPMP